MLQHCLGVGAVWRETDGHRIRSITAVRFCFLLNTEILANSACFVPLRAAFSRMIPEGVDVLEKPAIEL